MNTTIRQTTQRSTMLAAIATALVVAAVPSMSRADTWELRTVSQEVPGTREIEAGKPEKAIRISKVRLNVIPESLKVAVLTNLCIGHLLVKEFDQAEQYCDQAVSKPNQRTVTYNNRGVLRVMQGNYAAARRDFAIAAEAGCFNGCDPTIAVPQDLPRPVARRNLARAETRLLADEAASDVSQQTARAE